jgi:hypothetical protein
LIKESNFLPIAKFNKKGMTLNVPENLKEMKLGQLIALAEIFETTTADELNVDRLEIALSDFFDLTLGQVRKMSRLTLERIIEAMTKSFVKCSKEYLQVFERKDFIRSFRCQDKELFRIQKKVGLFQKKSFFVNKDIENEPAGIWLTLLDGSLRKINQCEKMLEQWQHIPRVVACLAWKRRESRFTKGLDGEPVVNFDRIERMEKVFLQMRAIDAVSVFAFFLNNQKSSLNVQYSDLFSKKLNIKT